MAAIWNRSASADNILILGVRESATQPFRAPNWLDLRVGMYLSLTNATTNETTTGLGETITPVGGATNPADYIWIGVKDHGTVLPAAGTAQFIGFSQYGPNPLGNSVLSSSDLGVGVSNAYYWRPNNSINNTLVFQLLDNAVLRAYSQDGVQPHFYQAADPGNPAGYYCGMLGFRLTRPAVNSRMITVKIPHIALHSSDMDWTATPTQQQLLSKLDPWPGTVQTLGPINFSFVPDSLFAYWPFHNSRLRISAMGVLRTA